MKMISFHRPGFFESLLKSCSSREFYQNIDRIRLRRSIGFLFLLSLLLAMIGSAFSYFYFSRPAFQESILTFYEKNIPEFQSTLHDETLETTPSHFALFFQFHPDGTLKVLDRPTDTTFFTVRVDTEKSMEEVHPETEAMPGALFTRDGMIFFNGFQSERFEYTLLNVDGPISFSKQDLKSALRGYLPEVLAWFKNASITFAPAIFFFYVFLTSWLVALLASIPGLLYTLIAKKNFTYGFFMKLSFYASVPAIVIILFTKSLGMPVPYLGFLVYACFYGYGLSTYES